MLTQKKTKAIMLGDTPVKRVMFRDKQIWPEEPVYPTESIVVKIAADRLGRIYLPKNGTYDWNVSIDGGPVNRYTGSGAEGGFQIGGGFEQYSEHIITITPYQENYGRARAFGYYNTGEQGMITEVIYDSTYKGCAESETNAGNSFRDKRYSGCTGITKATASKLPESVTNIGINFGFQEFFRCGNLREVTIYATPETVTKGGYYRAQQFYEAGSVNNPMTVTIYGDNVETSSENSLGLDNSRVAQIKVKASLVEEYKNSPDRSNIDDSKFVAL